MLDSALTAKGLTQSFTPQQREAVNGHLTQLVDHCLKAIEARQFDIIKMDKRPRQSGGMVMPCDVYFPYVGQAMLEDLITMLRVHV